MTIQIFDCVRTPRGKGIAANDQNPGGALAHLSPQELVRQLIQAIDQRAQHTISQQCSSLFLGCVGQVGSQGGHIALVSKLAAGLPSIAAQTLNNYCASGLTAINTAAAWSGAMGDQLMLAGGVEMLSQVPFLADNAALYTDPKLRTQLFWMPPSMGSELMAAREGFSRTDLDRLVVRSHQRAAKAWARGYFSRSCIPVHNADGSVALDKDEWINPAIDADALAELPLLFPPNETNNAIAQAIAKADPTLNTINFIHSPAHLPGRADGAALALVGSASAGVKHGITPRAEIVAFAESGGDPVVQFGAGFTAMEQALTRAGLTIADLDLIEFMEAFPAPPLHFERHYKPDMEKVNVNGGHLAMGHPMGATGAILVSILLDELERREVSLGMVVALGATGVGSALIVRRCDG